MSPTTSKTEYARALDRLAEYLTERDHSRFELKEKLSRTYPAELIEDVLSAAEKKGWLQNEGQMAARAALSWQRKLKSRRYIEAQLQKRQLPLPSYDEEQEIETMRTLVNKKFGPPAEWDKATRARAYRYLESRGFETEKIGMVFHASEF